LEDECICKPRQCTEHHNYIAHLEKEIEKLQVENENMKGFISKLKELVDMGPELKKKYDEITNRSNDILRSEGE